MLLCGEPVELSQRAEPGAPSHPCDASRLFVRRSGVVRCGPLTTIDQWWPEILHFCERPPPIVLVGTKADLRTDADASTRLREKGLSAVTREEAEAMAKEIGAVMFVETSSLRQLGVRCASTVF